VALVAEVRPSLLLHAAWIATPGVYACIEDETPIRPSTVYRKWKAATWLAIQAAAQHYGFAAAWARLFLPYG